jgi:DNA invertase Pin-like site-specific DNA recombinase
MGFTTRVLGVLRLSRETEESSSIERQREHISDWARRHGFVVAGWAVDSGVSGAVSVFKRPGLGPWLTDEQVGDYDIVVGWKLDRLGRNTRDVLHLVEWLEARGKAVATTDGAIQDTSTPAGKLQLTVLAGMAEFERAQIRSRVSDSIRHHRTRGLYKGGTLPYGHVPVGGKGNYRLAVIPEQRDQVRAWVDEVIAGASINSVAHRAGWSRLSMFEYLQRRVLIGEGEHYGQPVIGVDGNPVKVVEGDPMLTAVEFDRLQVALAGRRDNRSREAKTNPLAGLLFCECGMPMDYNGRVDGRRYRCRSKAAESKHDCGAVSLWARYVFAGVDEIVRQIGRNPETVREWVPGDGDELVRVEKAINRLREDRDLGVIGEREYAEQIKPLVTRRNALQEEGLRPGAWVETRTGRSISKAYSSAANDEERRQVLLRGAWKFIVADVDQETGGRIIRAVRDDTSHAVVAVGKSGVDVLATYRTV